MYLDITGKFEEYWIEYVNNYVHIIVVDKIAFG